MVSQKLSSKQNKCFYGYPHIKMHLLFGSGFHPSLDAAITAAVAAIAAIVSA
jgi:hypothetical protein